MWQPSAPWVPGISLGQLRANLAVNGPELYIGTDGRRLVWAGPQQAMLVLGPPRSGKTSTLVVPNVLAAPGPVLVTSTKTDVLQATLASRSQLGRCWLLDPTGTIELPAGPGTVRWSPVQASISWEEALVTARVMTAAARPQGSLWRERALDRAGRGAPGAHAPCRGRLRPRDARGPGLGAAARPSHAHGLAGPRQR